MRRLPTPLLLGVLLAIATAVRIANINQPSLNMDEFYEIRLAHEPVGQIINAADSMPPLYPLVHKAWISLWGTDAAARWFSLICGLASVVCVWGIGRQLVDNATGLAAAFVVAILPMHVFYSQFARSYSLMFLLIALALWLLPRAAASDRWRDWVLFALVAILGAYTHYYFAIFVATTVVVVCLQRRQVWIGRRALATYVGIGLAAVPLLWFLATDLEFQKGIRKSRPINIATIGYTYFSLFSGYSLGPSTTELQTMTGGQAVRSAAPWIAAVGIVLVVLGYHGWRRLWQRQTAATVLVLLLAPVVLLSALSFAGGLNYNVRFVAWIAIAVAVWLGAGVVESWQEWPVRLAFGALIVISSTALYNRNYVARYQNEDLHGAAAFLRANAASSDTVYVVSDYLADVARYYLGDGWRVVELPLPGELSQVVEDREAAERAVATVSLESPPGHPIWLIYSRPFHGDPQGLLLKELQERRSLARQAELAGVTIYRGE